MMNGATSVIDKYEQIWCFGFKPSNSGNPSDAEIDLPTSFPASDAELLKLSQWMKDKIDSVAGRFFYSRRMGIVEPVFGNIRSNLGLDRFTLRSKPKVNAQWNLYCLVHNIEKLAHHGYAQ